MKTLASVLFMLGLVCISSAQNVNIPDINFKNALINYSVDTNYDGEISYAEAEAICYLFVFENSITNLTGIEAFVNLDTLEIANTQATILDVSACTALKFLACAGNLFTSLNISGCTSLIFLNCEGNQLDSLDVSNNTSLSHLECHNNKLVCLNTSGNSDLYYLDCGLNYLSSLDVSACNALIELYCANNLLDSLDVSGNTALRSLSCSGNKLTSLDVSINVMLEYLTCSYNQLTTLDISNNTNIQELGVSNMPTLYEVCVWITPFPPAGVYIEASDSPNMYFSDECAANIPGDYKENSMIYFYQNPSDDIINIEIENINNATIEIYNVSGKLIFCRTLNSRSEKINISHLPKGTYLVKIIQDNTAYAEKMVVR